MAKRVKFVMNRKNFVNQILKGDETQAVLARAARAAAEGTGAEVTSMKGRNRARASIAVPMSEEAQSGTASRALGRVRV